MHRHHWTTWPISTKFGVWQTHKSILIRVYYINHTRNLETLNIKLSIPLCMSIRYTEILWVLLNSITSTANWKGAARRAGLKRQKRKRLILYVTKLMGLWWKLSLLSMWMKYSQTGRKTIDWLIVWIEFYAVSAIFQPSNGGKTTD